jgi:hypothetical protein
LVSKYQGTTVTTIANVSNNINAAGQLIGGLVAIVGWDMQ